MYAIYQSLWVRKLIGKPAFLTIADCESEVRRIHSSNWNVTLRHVPKDFLAEQNGANRVQKSGAPPNRRYASFHGLRNSRVNSLAASRSPMMCSFFASHLSLRPTSMEIRPR